MTHAAVSSTPAHDRAFSAFLTARRQLVQIGNPGPQFHCGCPVWGIGNHPIMVRHREGCGTTGRADATFTRVGRDDTPARTIIQHGADLGALAAWIPVPPPPPVVDPVVAEAAIRWMIEGLGFHLIPLRPGEKLNAAGTGWNDPEKHPALTVDQALAHVRAGGGLGVLLGPSRLLVIDTEDARATAAVEAAGYRPAVITAKGGCPVACDPRVDKRGGGHFWFLLPEGFDYTGVTNQRRALPGGGEVDVLIAPGSMAVVPPTALTAAGGWAYTPADHPVWTDGDRAAPPAWLFDAAVDCPETVASLGGVLVPRQGRAAGPRSERALAVDDAVDDIDWLGVIALASGRIEDWGRVDGCGCPEYHWHSSGEPRSIVTHGCTEHGLLAYIPSETMRLELGLEKTSCRPLTLACRLLGREPYGDSAKEVGRMLGVELPIGWRSLEERGLQPLGTVSGVPRMLYSPLPTSAVQAPELRVGDVVAGVTPGLHAVPVAPVLPPAVAVPAPGDEDDADGDRASDAENRALLRDLRPKVVALEERIKDLTPGLRRAYDYAESEGVFYHGLLGGLMPRLLQDVPPNVLAVSRTGKRGSKSRGSGVNAYVLGVAPSSAGKSETQKSVEACLPVRAGVARSTAGTAEAWAKKLRGRTSSGVDYIKATSLLVYIDEVVALNKELERPGTALHGFIASSWTGIGGGQDTSDEKNAAVLPSHGSRVGIFVSGQPSRLRTLAATADQGAGARFKKALVGLVSEQNRGPLYGRAVPTVVADQSGQPWYNPGPVGIPPIVTPAVAAPPRVPEQQGVPLEAPLAVDPPRIGNVAGGKPAGASGDSPGIPGYDDAPAIWIDLPDSAVADMTAGLAVAAARAENWLDAFEQDRVGVVTGHRVHMRVVAAFCFAILDGEYRITDAHWEAAGLWLEGSDLVGAAVNAVLELGGEAEANADGRLRGIFNAAGKAAEAEVTAEGIASARGAIIRRLMRLPGWTSKLGYLKSGHTFPCGTRVSGMSDRQKQYAVQAAEQMKNQGELIANGDGSWTLTRALAA